MWPGAAPSGLWPWFLRVGCPRFACPPGCAAPSLLSSSRIGGEKVILLSTCAWGFITAVTPLLAHLSSAHLVFMTFSRILTGLLQGRAASLLPSLVSAVGEQDECTHVVRTRVYMHTRAHSCPHVCSHVWHALDQRRRVHGSVCP